MWEAERRGHVIATLPSMFAGQRCRRLALGKINALKVSPGKQRCIVGKLTMLVRRKENRRFERQWKLPGCLSDSTAQGRFTRLFALSVKARGISYVKSRLSNSSAQPVLIVNVHTLKKKSQQRYSHRRCVKSLSAVREYLAIISEKGEWNVCFTPGSVYSADTQPSAADTVVSP